VCGCCDELASSRTSIIEFRSCTSLPVKYGVPGVCGAAEVDPDTRAEGAEDRCAAEGATSCEFPNHFYFYFIRSIYLNTDNIFLLLLHKDMHI
jgi:hypothetical protein